MANQPATCTITPAATVGVVSEKNVGKDWIEDYLSPNF